MTKFETEMLKDGKNPFEANGVQTFLREFGNGGCYCLCIMRLALRLTGQIAVGAGLLGILEGIKRGWIHYGGAQDPDNFYMEHPDKFLTYLTDQKWRVRKEDADYQCKEGEFEILKYDYGSAKHFCLADFDPLENSESKAKGVLSGKRIFWRA